MNTHGVQSFLLWLGETGLGRFMRDYTWPSSVAVVLHLVGLILLGATTVLASFSGLRKSGGEAASATLRRELRLFFWLGLGVAAVTGVALVAAKAENYYDNPVFWTKLGLLVPAVISAVVLQRETRSDAESVNPAEGASPVVPRVGRRIAHGLNLALWLGVAATGRGIGVF